MQTISPTSFVVLLSIGAVSPNIVCYGERKRRKREEGSGEKRETNKWRQIKETKEEQRPGNTQ